MAQGIKYVGPSCGRHIEDDDVLTAKRAVGYSVAALLAGYCIWQFIALLFAVFD